MKKTFSIFLITAFIFNAAGYLLIFLVLQSSLKDRAEEKLVSDNHVKSAVVLAFSKADFEEGIKEFKMMDEREFSFRGKMYDIIKTVNKNDSLYFYCIADTDEDDLNLAFSRNGNGDDGNKNAANKNLLKNILQDGLLTKENFRPLNFSPMLFLGENTLQVTSSIREIPTPPPVKTTA